MPPTLRGAACLALGLFFIGCGGDGQAGMPQPTDLASLARTTITDAGGNDGSQRLSPDGQTLALSSDRDGLSDIYLVPAHGGDVVLLTSSGVWHSFPAWSPDGREIVFSSAQNGLPDIWIMNADGSNARQLTNTDALDMVPTWSPDGTTIYYLSNASGNNDIV